MKTLKNATLEELYAEIQKRELNGYATKQDKEYAELKAKNVKGWTTAKKITLTIFSFSSLKTGNGWISIMTCRTALSLTMLWN